jgi:hypothetical protein
MTTNTTMSQKTACRKLNLLKLAANMENVSKACNLMGYSRQLFYENWWNFQTFGFDGLLKKVHGPKNPRPNLVPEKIEKASLAHCLDSPMHGSRKVSQQLTLKGINIGARAVRAVL